jgi:hypothetical protein
MPKDLVHRSAFESQGETYVRKLAQDSGTEVGREAAAWLAEQQSLRDGEAASKRDSREEETLSISKRSAAIAEEALSIAKDSAASASRAAAAAETQARWAKWAAIIATVAAIATASMNIHELITWLQR